jgi:predicted ABC-type ATPase
MSSKETLPESGGRTSGSSDRRMGPQPKSERPVFWIVAGPNGSGKSSLYSTSDVEAFDQSIWIINPDLLTERIRQVEKLPPQEANLQAVIRVEAWLEASINAHQTVGVETVLSTDKYRRHGKTEAVRIPADLHGA